MYDYIEGEVTSRSPTQVVLSAGGVGYRFVVPLSTYDALSDAVRARLLAYLYVREDVLRLYGFATEDERRLFARLIGISGIGPGTAIALLNGMSVGEFRAAAARADALPIQRVKGIGPKIARRIVTEMSEEMSRELVEQRAEGAPVSALTSDAVAAMLALGYKRSASEQAVARAFASIGREAPLAAVIRKALQVV